MIEFGAAKRPFRGSITSAEIIGHNEDLLLQLFILLPAKPLIKFSTVSKKWLSVISDPQFRTAHSTRYHSPKPSAILLNNNFSPPPTFQVVPLNGNPRFRVPALNFFDAHAPLVKIWQSCNGLLLCSSTSTCQLRGPDRGDIGLAWEKVKFPMTGITYHICNPTTRQFRTLANYPNFEFVDSIHAVNLAFDPAISPHYRVICIRNLPPESNTHHAIDVYFSETGSWKSIGSFTLSESDRTVFFRHPVYCNGAIHWDSVGDTSLYFDVNNLCLKRMSMPSPALKWPTRYFGESRGHLHKIKIDHCSNMKFDVFEMRGDYSGWYKKYSVNLNLLVMKLWGWGLNIDLRGNCDAFSVFSLLRAEKEEESTLVIFVSGRAVAYDLNSKQFMSLGDVELCHEKAFATLDYGGFSAYQYMDTLACV